MIQFIKTKIQEWKDKQEKKKLEKIEEEKRLQREKEDQELYERWKKKFGPDPAIIERERQGRGEAAWRAYEKRKGQTHGK